MQREFAILFHGGEKVFPKVMPSVDPEVMWQPKSVEMQRVYSINLKSARRIKSKFTPINFVFLPFIWLEFPLYSLKRFP
jgi:hypothetical protein